MSDPTYFVEPTALGVRSTECPDANFTNGMNASGSNSPGIGINEGEGEVVGTAEQFTLLDQDGDARAPQVGQVIGGEGLTVAADLPGSGGAEGKGTVAILVGTNPDQAAKDADPTKDGAMTSTGSATLASLAAGWTAV